MGEKINSPIDTLVTAAEKGVKSVEKNVEMLASPARKTLLIRFPILFAVLVTIGVSMTLLGLEQVLLSVPFLYDHPLVMFLIGVGILVLTGKLYKKLG